MAGSKAGVGGIYNQVNLNLYHYAGNNSIKYTDPDGKSVLGKVLGYGCYIAVVVAPAAVTLAGKLTVVGTAILATDVITEKIGENLAKSKGNKESEAKPADKPSLMPEAGAESSKPENKSPEGAGRKGALNEAKRKNGIPTSQQPEEQTPNYDKRGNKQPGRQYKYRDSKVIL